MEPREIQVLSDQELVVMLKRGSHPAFTEIYNRYWDKLYFVATSKLDNDPLLAEELVQDIFLDLWRRKSELDIVFSLNTYLAAAMKYKVIDARAKKVRAINFIKETERKLSNYDSSTLDQLSFRELCTRLEFFVGRLPEKCRLVYTLNKKDGLSQKEIASKLKLSEKTVESHLSRAMKTLRANLRSIKNFFI